MPKKPAQCDGQQDQMQRCARNRLVLRAPDDAVGDAPDGRVRVVDVEPEAGMNLSRGRLERAVQ